jgi:protein TonB
MEPKKYKKASLENKKGIFFEIGLVVALGLVLVAFEWTSEPEKVEGFEEEEETDVVQQSVPVTRQEQQEKPPPPPPPKTTEVIKIVDDDVNIEDELNLQTTEADQQTEVSIDAFVEDEKEEESEGGQIFVKVEDMPEFKGKGIGAFRNYIQRNIEYPTIAAENGIEGTVFLKFVVEKDGSISNVRVLRGVDPALDKEAVKTVENAPEWEPGKQRGKPVRVSFSIPIVFQLE